MAIPLNPLSDRQTTYKSKVDYLSLRTTIACPAKYTLFLTNGCNFVCDMCTQPVVGKAKRRFMSLGLIDKVLEETSWTYPVYTLFGGEPLLHPFFDDIVRKIRKTCCDHELVTNGYFLESHVKEIIRAECDLIISMSGVESVNNSVKHNKESYNKIKKSIDLIRATSKEYLSEKLSVNCVAIPDNINTLIEFIDELDNWGVKKLTIQHPQWIDNQIKSKTDEVWQKYFGTSYDTLLKMNKAYDFDDSHVARLLRVKENLEHRDYGIKIKFFPDFSEPEVRMYYDSYGCMLLNTDDVCLTPWLNAMIQEDGEVKSCTGYSIGNINDSSFWELWNGEKNQHFRKELMLHRKYAVCNRCCMMYQKTGEYGE